MVNATIPGAAKLMRLQTINLLISSWFLNSKIKVLNLTSQMMVARITGALLHILATVLFLGKLMIVLVGTHMKERKNILQIFHMSFGIKTLWLKLRPL